MRDVRQAELDLIRRDCADLVEVVRRLQASPELGAAALGLPPYFALVAGESYSYLASPAAGNLRHTVGGALFQQYAASVTKLRARVKLFDDTKGGLEGLVTTLGAARQKSLDWFLFPHTGLRGFFARRLQPDLGVFWVNELPVASTHSALITLGLREGEIAALDLRTIEDEVGAFAFNWSTAAGEYLAQVSGIMATVGYQVDLNVDGGSAVDLSITHTDHYGKVIYEHLAGSLGVGDELEAAVFFVLTQVGFVNAVLPQFLPEDSILLLRAQYLTAYHATTALRTLAALDAVPASSMLGELASGLLAGEDSTFLISNRELRNSFAHYALRKSSRFLGDDDAIESVIEGVSGRSLSEVKSLAQRQLAAISAGFAGVASKPVFWPLRNAFGENT